MSINPTYGTEDTYAPDNLIAGGHPLITDTVTIASGQNLTRGAVLGKITAGGKYNLSASAAVDGSQTPVAILAKDTDASGADKEAPVYIAGEFNERTITLGAGHTVASVKDGLAARSIYLQPTVAA